MTTTTPQLTLTQSLKPGSKITITVTRAPSRPDDVDTLRRLMRMNGRTQKVLTQAGKVRARTTRIEQRGGRDWKVRPQASKMVHPTKGVTWTLNYRPQIAPDIESVARYITIK